MLEAILRSLYEGADWALNWIWERIVQLISWCMHWLLSDQTVQELVRREASEIIDRHVQAASDDLWTLVSSNSRIWGPIVTLMLIFVLALGVWASRASRRRNPTSR